MQSPILLLLQANSATPLALGLIGMVLVNVGLGVTSVKLYIAIIRDPVHTAFILERTWWGYRWGVFAIISSCWLNFAQPCCYLPVCVVVHVWFSVVSDLRMLLVAAVRPSMVTCRIPCFCYAELATYVVFLVTRRRLMVEATLLLFYVA